MKKIFIILFCFLLSGCATLNFSSKYYTPPENYKTEVHQIWDKFLSEHKLKNKYDMIICADKSTSTPGVPEIKMMLPPNYSVYMPDYFVRYVYEFYYNNREVIFNSIFAHEIAHAEFNLPDKPPEKHYLVDGAAIVNFFPNTQVTDDNFYSSLCVISYYWQARKGAGGHLFNIGWNALNIYAIAMGGIGSIGDLYATDISTRLNLLQKDSPSVKFVFKRSHFPKNN